ncbi:ATP-dependent DNA helicase RecG (plasmid) [Clostridium botulinum Af84]|uniref:ATP-dependent DNA helicase RecG n=1 Tax=Clostridium botulinum TaxID=1491 RepID=UPI00035BAE76|nr:ATP-dependent DNA helicase RecG [Clostridium botulinum]APR02596.1 DEAD/DEAH box helicase family protein [Clostridium botulinum]AUN19852.1 ATP-dependent DNA helicase RecG [Clostridium botulinum]EPS54471.1 ATP-dependent DNA helicase RecG [Clostridium botulinum Af84]NFM82796.1 ATP-dependent DNA helicase RecG [Clostridium botulinum]NFP10082.1 ATP-dependent DNA helicase RecG [Clostridium botulinum]
MISLDNLDIPKKKVNQFKKKNINSIEELVRFFPSKYLDFRKQQFIHQLIDGQTTSIAVTITKININKIKQYIKVNAIDDFGAPLCLIWFNNIFINKKLSINTKYIVCGTVSINYKYNNQIQIINPIYISKETENFKKIMPVYSKITGMSYEYLTNSIENALKLINTPEYLEENLLEQFKLQNEMEALINIHAPLYKEQIIGAKRRFIFDTLFQYQFQLENKNRKSKKKSEIKIRTLVEYKKLLDKLPFKLTQDQNKAIDTILNQMQKNKKVNTLLTADVGAGKTVIAFLIIIILVENGYQGVLMAPTSVLAKQHFNEFNKLLCDTPFKACFLNGTLKASEKKEILQGIKEGVYNVIIGTHSVIQKDVKFKKLGVAVIDEEHRFGVSQRAVLLEKTNNIHYVTMSATPIPRSLALTMYGDNIEIVTIKTMPNGRKPIKTALINNKKKAYNFMLKEIKKGHQCYFVCPLIEKSYCESMENIDSIEDIYIEMNTFFKNKDIKLSMVTGKMKEEQIDKEINKFKNNETQIIIATTVIEVGINVPNATTIVINNAERFGLAQLHQLRGRVGRSSLQSYCILISSKNSERLQVMTTTNDGFIIANKDLKLRGSGNLIGEEQSGKNEFVQLINDYPNLFRKIKNEIEKIYINEKRLKKYEWLLNNKEIK